MPTAHSPVYYLLACLLACPLLFLVWFFELKFKLLTWHSKPTCISSFAFQLNIYKLHVPSCFCRSHSLSSPPFLFFPSPFLPLPSLLSSSPFPSPLPPPFLPLSVNFRGRSQLAREGTGIWMGFSLVKREDLSNRAARDGEGIMEEAHLLPLSSQA